MSCVLPILQLKNLRLGEAKATWLGGEVGELLMTVLTATFLWGVLQSLVRKHSLIMQYNFLKNFIKLNATQLWSGNLLFKLYPDHQVSVWTFLAYILS